MPPASDTKSDDERRGESITDTKSMESPARSDELRGDSINDANSNEKRPHTDKEKTAESTQDDPPAAPFSPMHEVAFVFVICMAQFLSLAGLGQSIAPLNIIGR